MPYSNFSFDQVKEVLELDIEDKHGLFDKIAEHELPQDFVDQLLGDSTPLALAINTEKARSELIVTPVLMEVRKIENKRISLFSGVEFNVDDEHDLRGTCDFIISLSKEQFFINSPIITIVEAKRDNIHAGIPQCIAEMKAAQIFNERKQNPLKTIYGAVTTGSNWKFLKLVDNSVTIDLDEYYIKDVNKIVGILRSMCEEGSQTT